MNSKFYVSLEVARLLKEKGYNEYCNYYHYVKNKEERFVYCRDARNEDFYEWTAKIYTAPTLLEAMDWLDERGILITIAWLERAKEWTFIFDGIKDSIAATKILDYYYRKRHTDNFADRNECMQKAIEKALELL